MKFIDNINGMIKVNTKSRRRTSGNFFKSNFPQLKKLIASFVRKVIWRQDHSRGLKIFNASQGEFSPGLCNKELIMIMVIQICYNGLYNTVYNGLMQFTLHNNDLW